MDNKNQLPEIVDGGYCIGCGACNVVDPAISIELDEYGKYQADIFAMCSSSVESVLNVCPFSNEGANEDDIGNVFFGEDCKHDSNIGYYHSLFVGHVEEGTYRESGGSGGIITWLSVNLLQTGEVDHVIHVKQARRQTEGCLFKYGISSSTEEIIAGAKSRYYPVEMSQVLALVRERPGRYAFVGIPCFVKAVRQLMASDPVIEERIKYCVGLVCGHLKSAAFADSFGWQYGIAPGELETIDFRIKLPGETVVDYGVYLRGGGQELTKPRRAFLGANWGYNFFRYSACDYCDDVFAETADIAIGDAWLPQFENDPKGNSVVVVRDPSLGKLLHDAMESNRLWLQSSDVNEMERSQEGGLRDRREGLAHRLYVAQKKKAWVPHKRVTPQNQAISFKRKLIYRNRSKMGSMSHRYWKKAVKKNSFRIFSNQMHLMILWNLILYQGLLRTLVSTVKKISRRG